MINTVQLIYEHVVARLLSREDWTTQQMAAKLLTAVIDNRPKKSSAFANGLLAGDATPSVTATFGGPDPAEPVSSSPCKSNCIAKH